MSFFRLRTLPGNTWPPVPDGSLAHLWSAYLHLDRTQWLDPAELQRHQLSQVRTLLAHAVAQVPYYRQVLPAAGIVPARIHSLDDFRATGTTGAELQPLLAGVTLPHWVPQLAPLLETGPAHGMDVQQDCRQ